MPVTLSATMKLTDKAIAAIAAPTESDPPQLYRWDTETHGFGVVIGRSGRRTFVWRGRVNGQQRKVTIGVAGQPRADGRVWNTTMASQEAKLVPGRLAEGKEPAPAKIATRSSGPTLRDALDFHVERMERGENRRKKVCSPRSVLTLRGTVELHLADYLERPLVELTREVMRETITTIEREAERVAGSNPKNPPGRAVANRLVANVSAIWNSWDEEHDMPIKAPVSTKMQASLKPRDNRIGNAELADWYAKVMGMENAIRRDLQLVALFTGVRTDGVRNLRWDDVDFDEETLDVTRAKGDRPYTLPMTDTVRELLEKRREDNATTFAKLGGDGGYVFPSFGREDGKVIPVAEVKERRVKRNAKGKAVRDDAGNVIRETYLPGVQACRKTFNSVAIEIGIPGEAREALMNHEGRGVNVKSYGFPQNWDYLRSCADQIEAALWERIRGNVKQARPRARLRSVS